MTSHPFDPNPVGVGVLWLRDRNWLRFGGQGLEPVPDLGRTRAEAAAEAARQIEIMAALRATTLRDFGMSWFLVAPGVPDDAPRADWIDAAQPRVAVRADGRRWILTTIEASHLALTLRLTRRWSDEGQGVTVMDLVADALGAAARQAEARLSDLRGVA